MKNHMVEVEKVTRKVRRGYGIGALKTECYTGLNSMAIVFRGIKLMLILIN